MFYLFIIVFALYYWGISHAWKMVKVARYLREHKNERRKSKLRRSFSIYHLPFADRRILAERRSGIDRRYQATARDPKFFLKQTRSSKFTEAFKFIGRKHPIVPTIKD